MQAYNFKFVSCINRVISTSMDHYQGKIWIPLEILSVIDPKMLIFEPEMAELPFT